MAFILRRLSGNFFPSWKSIAGYFNVHRTTVYQALRELEDFGFLEAVRREPGKSVNYRVVSHEEWSERNPGLCIKKESFPWTGEGDPLARELYAASGGQAKFFTGQMQGLRTIGFSDEQIAHEFRVFLIGNPQQGAKWKSVYYRFYSHVRRLADGDARVAKSRSNP